MIKQFTSYDQAQTFFEVIDPKKIITERPLMNAIDWFIENHVGEQEFIEKLNNKTGGRCCKHPKMLLKVLFFAYSQGIYSSREIESQLKVNIDFKALSGNSFIDHSTICRFILVHSKIIKNCFVKLTYVMMQEEYIDCNFIAIDGTKMKANAGERFYGSVSDFEKRKVTLSQKVNDLLLKTTHNKLSHRQNDKKKQMENSLNKINAFLEEVEKSEKPKTYKANLTDRDSRKMKISGSYKSGYNCQAGADGKHHVIVSQEVYNNASDYQFAIPLIKKIKEGLDVDLKMSTVSLDAGYYSSSNLMALDQMGIDVCIPEGGSGSAIRKKKTDAIDSRDCTIYRDGDNRVLICPEGIKRIATEARARNGLKGKQWSYNFYMKQSECKGCKLYEKCYLNYSSKTGKKFSVTRDYFDSIDIRKKMEAKLNSELGKRQVADRACLIEHVFGEIKHARKFRYFRHRGLTKVRTIWSMLCTAYNFNKLAKLKFMPT